MTLRYKLRTLLILLAVLPPLLWIGWTKYAAWKAEQERRAQAELDVEYQIAVLKFWLTTTGQQAPPNVLRAPGNGNAPEEPRE